MESNSNSAIGCVLGGILGVMLGASITAKALDNEWKYKYPIQPRNTISVDVNQDGLEDLVDSEGNIEVKQKDGSYLPLRGIIEREIAEKYTFKPEQVRNSIDNLDYKINTGRYVIGQ